MCINAAKLTLPRAPNNADIPGWKDKIRPLKETFGLKFGTKVKDLMMAWSLTYFVRPDVITTTLSGHKNCKLN